MIARDVLDAVNLLAGMRVGDPVTVEFDCQQHDMIVSREMRRADGAYGSVESSRITVTFGPGRYSREITAEQLAGRWPGSPVTLARRSPAPGCRHARRSCDTVQ